MKMEVIARTKYIRVSPRKMRLVADLVRGLKTGEALAILTHLHKSAARPLLLALKQGVANATHNFHLDSESLLIKELEIGKGPTLKRGRPVARGRWHPILKRTSHIRMVLEGERKQKKQIEKKRKMIRKVKKTKKRRTYGTKS